VKFGGTRISIRKEGTALFSHLKNYGNRLSVVRLTLTGHRGSSVLLDLGVVFEKIRRFFSTITLLQMVENEVRHLRFWTETIQFIETATPLIDEFTTKLLCFTTFEGIFL